MFHLRTRRAIEIKEWSQWRHTPEGTVLTVKNPERKENFSGI